MNILRIYNSKLPNARFTIADRFGLLFIPIFKIQYPSPFLYARRYFIFTAAGLPLYTFEIVPRQFTVAVIIYPSLRNNKPYIYSGAINIFKKYFDIFLTSFYKILERNCNLTGRRYGIAFFYILRRDGNGRRRYGR